MFVDEDDFEDEEDDDEEDKVVEINSPPKNHSNPVDGALSDNEDTKLSFEEQNGSLETDEGFRSSYSLQIFIFSLRRCFRSRR